MINRNIREKVIAGIMVFLMTFTNFGLLGNGLMEVIAQNTTKEEKAKELNAQVVIDRYVQYNNAENKGVLLRTKLELGMKENKEGHIPTLNNKIEIQVPMIEGNLPLVSVLATSTESTNGKNEGQVEFSNENWKYDNNSGLLTISYENKEGYSEYKEDSKDKFEIIYSYPESSYTGYDNTLILPIEMNVEKVLKNGNEEINIKKQIDENIELTNKLGDIVTVDLENINEIYKGYLNENIDTEYKAKETIEIIDNNLVDKIELNNKSNTYLINDEEKEAEIQYKNTKIAKADFDKILGENGILEIWDDEEKIVTIKYEETDGIKKLIKEKISGEKEEIIDTINVEYEKETREITLKTTKPQSVGKIAIENTKIIKASEEIKQINRIKENSEIIAVKENKIEEETSIIEISKFENIEEIELKEPINGIEVELKDKNGNKDVVISTLNENKLTYTATLRTDSSKYNLLDNPEIQINIPKEINYIKAESINVLQGEGIELGKVTHGKNEDGTSIIKIELKGKQAKYTTSITDGIKLTMELTVNTSKEIPSQASKISTTIINKNLNTTYETPIQIQSKNGLLMVTAYNGYNSSNQKTEVSDNRLNSILIGNDTVEKNLEQKIYLVNNHDEKINNVELICKLGYINEELKSTFTTYLKDSNTNKGTILYTIDGNNWVEEVEDITKVVAYKIVINEIDSKEVVSINSELILPAKLDNNEKTYINSNIKYTVSEMQNSQEQTTEFYTPQIENTKLQMIADQNILLNNADKDIIVTTKATIGGKDITSADEIKAGQYIRYYVALTNNSNTSKDVKIVTDIENGQFYEVKNTGIEYGPNVTSTRYMLAAENDLQRNKTYKIESGQTIIHEYQVKVNNAANTIKNKNTISYDQVVEESIIENKVKEAKIILNLEYAFNEEKEVYSAGDKLPIILTVSNITDKSISNIETKIDIPDELGKDIELMKNGIFGEELLPYEEKEVEIKDNQLIWKVDKLEKGQTKNLYINFITEELDIKFASKDISIIANAEIGKEIYTSNEIIKTINQSNENLLTTFTSNIKDNATLNSNENLEYFLKIDNKGALNVEGLSIEALLEQGVNIRSITLKNTTTGEEKEINPMENNYVLIEEQKLNINDSIELKLIANINIDEIVSFENSLINQFNINTAKDAIWLEHEFYVEAPEIEDEIEDDFEAIMPDEEGDGDEEIEELPDEDNTIEEEMSYSISGIAWIDKDKNGSREENEELLQNIKVILINAENNTIVKNESGEQIISLTDANGEYRFENLKPGKYVVIFEYDNKTYSVTTYKKDNVNDNNNSDVVSSRVQIDGQSSVAAVTDILLLDNNLENIDIGLIENAKFDLKLDKYISKVVIKNSQGTETKTYENTKLAKVDFVAKYINSASLVITYKFVITNNGDVSGYVDKLSDNLPSGLEFSSELNKNWYQGSDGMLYTSLSNKAIEPGKTSEIELVLTKEMDENNTGTVTNTASLITISNLEGIKEEADNVIDNTSSADIILTIKTGSPFLYIGVTIACIGIIAIGAYLIKKKVLNRI